jgi:hypothetical protein
MVAAMVLVDAAASCYTPDVMRITRMCAFAALATLLAFSVEGDTIELKTGERIEGAFKQATPAGP